MRLSGGHDDHFAFLQAMGYARNPDFDLAVEDLDQCIKGRRMFAQTLSGIEGENGDRSGRFVDYLPADNGPLLVINQ